MSRLSILGALLLSLLLQPAGAVSVSSQNIHRSASQLEAPSLLGDCYIELANDSFSNVTVYGRYDDGVPLIPFTIYSYEYSHYIDMFNNGYCHSGMYLSIVTFSGYTIFSGYVFTGSTVHIVPITDKRVAAQITKREGK